MRQLETMIAIYLHPPKTIDAGEDFLVDSAWIENYLEGTGVVGNAVLVPVYDVRTITDGELRAALERLEDSDVVMVVRR